MSETFLHGVEVVEVNDGARPIRTVRSSVIGLIGTAPLSQSEVKASLLTGVVASNNALTYTSKLLGILGNKIELEIVNPGTVSATLAVTVEGRFIRVSLATDAQKAATTTATQLISAIQANAAANALVTVASTGASTGGAAVTTLRRVALAGGLDEAFPLNTPVLVAGSAADAARLGATGTLPAAIDAIFDQIGAVVIVVRVAADEDEADQLANVVGSAANDTGVHAFAGSESKTGFCPRILCAPGFTSQRPSDLANPVVAELIGIAERLRAVIIADGPSTTDAAAITYRQDFGSRRVYVVDPAVKIYDATGSVVTDPASARVAGLIAKIDTEQGFWWSPSNHEINGIIGTDRLIDFQLGDSSSRANLLNENEVATIIRKEGFKLWGNRTCSNDPKWAFLSVVRVADMINESILQAHMWAVDRNITKTYLEDVVDGVNAFMRRLQAQGAILGGQCWVDPDLNTPESIADGKVFFAFDFTPPFPAERITFRSKLVNDYIEEIL
jgi:phage tail sheath protein FI